MNTTQFDPNDLRIASPCPMSWNSMTGNERTRYCDLCKLNVHNIAGMTTSQVRQLIVQTDGRVCGKIYRRTDGTILTKDCPVGLRTYRRRVAGFASAVLAAILSAVGFGYGQKEESTTIDALKPGIIKTVNVTNGGKLTGVITDPAGAVVPNVKVAAYPEGKRSVVEVSSDAEGRFIFMQLPAGFYELKFSGIPGFKTLILQNVEIKADFESTADVILTPADVTEELLGVVATQPMIEMTLERKTVLTKETLDLLPRRRTPWDF